MRLGAKASLKRTKAESATTANPAFKFIIHSSQFIVYQAAPFILNSSFLILHSKQPHAAGYSQAGCDSRQDGDYRLNDEFPSFFFHSFLILEVKGVNVRFAH